MDLKQFTKIAMIAALYTAVSLALAPITYGNIQIRIAEALTLLPLIHKNSIYGLVLGCFLTNLLGAMLGINPTGYIDCVVGTFATLLACIFTYKLKDVKVQNIPVLSILMPVIFNGIIVGIELGVLLFPNSMVTGSIICGVEVAIGELISVIIGYFLIKALKNTKFVEE